MRRKNLAFSIFVLCLSTINSWAFIEIGSPETPWNSLSYSASTVAGVNNTTVHQSDGSSVIVSSNIAQWVVSSDGIEFLKIQVQLDSINFDWSTEADYSVDSGFHPNTDLVDVATIEANLPTVALVDSQNRTDTSGVFSSSTATPRVMLGTYPNQTTFDSTRGDTFPDPTGSSDDTQLGDGAVAYSVRVSLAALNDGIIESFDSAGHGSNSPERLRFLESYSGRTQTADLDGFEEVGELGSWSGGITDLDIREGESLVFFYEHVGRQGTQQTFAFDQLGATIPEPSTVMLLLGAAGFFLLRRRR